MEGRMEGHFTVKIEGGCLGHARGIGRAPRNPVTARTGAAEQPRGAADMSRHKAYAYSSIQ